MKKSLFDTPFILPKNFEVFKPTADSMPSVLPVSKEEAIQTIIEKRGVSYEEAEKILDSIFYDHEIKYDLIVDPPNTNMFSKDVLIDDSESIPIYTNNTDYMNIISLFESAFDKLKSGNFTENELIEIKHIIRKIKNYLKEKE